MSVRNVANDNPKIMVQLKGPQNATLSPPKKMWGFPVSNKDMKSMLNPMANGTNPNMVAVAVSNTGVIRVLPASMMASFKGMPCSINKSVNSTKRIPLRTTIPANATIPIPVITMEMFIPKMENPNNTPIKENKISERIKIGFEMELNWVTKINKIKPNEINMALPKNPAVSACCSCSPPMVILTDSGFLKFSTAA